MLFSGQFKVSIIFTLREKVNCDYPANKQYELTFIKTEKNS